MTKKDAFIKIVGNELFAENFKEIMIPAYTDEEIELAESYWKDFRKGASSNAKNMTENGYKILTFLQENTTDENSNFSAKEIGEAIGISGRSVSGSMRKLIADGYVDKEGQNPINYSITEKGMGYTKEN